MTHPPIVPGQEPGQVWPPNPSFTTDPFVEPERRRARPGLLAALGALALVVAGLSAWLVIGRGGNEPAPAAAAAGSSAPAATSAPASAPAGPKTAGLKLGAKVTVPASGELSSATVQVIAYKRDARLGEANALDAVQIRICLGEERPSETTVSGGPWSLLYDGGESRHQEVSTGGPAPEFPSFEERKLRPGECVKGWLAFTDAPGKPEGVHYELGSGFTASWRIA